MSAPIRSASASPFAAPRPLVQSRRVSLRVGSFGVTYATDKVLWSAEAPKAYATVDPPPVDPAPQIESERPRNQAETSTFPPDLEAARKRVLWNNAQNRAAGQQNASGQARQSTETTETDAAPEVAEAAEVQAATPAADASALEADASTSGTNAASGSQGAGRKASLVQAMRRATSAYLSCAACLATPGPMLQAIA